MSASYTRLFVHFVWATRLREPLITGAIASRVHGYIASRCEVLGCVPLAVGGVADHVHALVWMSPELGVAQLARELKAPTTRFIHRVLQRPAFAWQEGYGAFTMRESEIETVKRYVDRQASHHAQGTLVDEWERDTPPPNGA